MKQCRDCGQLKPLEEFSPSKKNVDGRVSYCRPCTRVRSQRYNAVRRDGPAVQVHASRTPPGTKWCPRCEQVLPMDGFGSNRSNSDGLTAYCKPCHNAVNRDNRIAKHGSTRSYHLQHRYGITAADADRMAEAQDGLCAICRDRPAQHVDHDHATGRVRELLCSCCNQGLGNLRDDPELMRRAAAYVERHRRRPSRRAPRLLDVGHLDLTPSAEAAERRLRAILAPV